MNKIEEGGLSHTEHQSCPVQTEEGSFWSCWSLSSAHSGSRLFIMKKQPYCLIFFFFFLIIFFLKDSSANSSRDASEYTQVLALSSFRSVIQSLEGVTGGLRQINYEMHALFFFFFGSR